MASEAKYWHSIYKQTRKADPSKVDRERMFPVTLNLRISRDDKAWLDTQAKKNNTNRSDIIRLVIETFRSEYPDIKIED